MVLCPGPDWEDRAVESVLVLAGWMGWGYPVMVLARGGGWRGHGVPCPGPGGAGAGAGWGREHPVLVLAGVLPSSSIPF